MVLRYAHHQPESLRGGRRCWIDCGGKVAQSKHKRWCPRVKVSCNPLKKWWRCPGLNGGPAAYESAALPTELHRQTELARTGPFDKKGPDTQYRKTFKNT